MKLTHRLKQQEHRYRRQLSLGSSGFSADPQCTESDLRTKKLRIRQPLDVKHITLRSLLDRLVTHINSKLLRLTREIRQEGAEAEGINHIENST